MKGIFSLYIALSAAEWEKTGTREECCVYALPEQAEISVNISHY